MVEKLGDGPRCPRGEAASVLEHRSHVALVIEDGGVRGMREQQPGPTEDRMGRSDDDKQTVVS